MSCNLPNRLRSGELEHLSSLFRAFLPSRPRGGEPHRVAAAVTDELPSRLRSGEQIVTAQDPQIELPNRRVAVNAPLTNPMFVPFFQAAHAAVNFSFSC